MPVPVLDGGHILIMALEGIARRDFSMQVKEKMLLAGLRRADDADGDGHLQRPHAHQLDRAPDALAQLEPSTPSVHRAWTQYLARSARRTMTWIHRTVSVAAGAGAHVPAAAQQTRSPQADIQRLQDNVYLAERDVTQLRSRDSARATQLQSELDELRDEVIYLQREAAQGAHAGAQRVRRRARSRIEDVRTRARGDASACLVGAVPRSLAALRPRRPRAGARSRVRAPARARRPAAEIPAGTELDVRLSNVLSSGTAQGRGSLRGDDARRSGDRRPHAGAGRRR